MVIDLPDIEGSTQKRLVYTYVRANIGDLAREKMKEVHAILLSEMQASLLDKDHIGGNKDIFEF